MKPTYGRVSRHGMIAFASSLDQAAAMARSAEDCAVLLGAMAGFDPRDSTSAERPDEDFCRELERPLAGLRIGVPREFLGDGLSGDVLMVGDESALPAIAGICGSLDPEAQGVAIIEVGHRDDIQDVQAPAGLDVRWIERGGAREGDAALEELRGLRLASDLGYAYSAGEQALATGTRRHLVRDRGVDKQRITFTGYWKLGKAYVS